MLAKLYKNEFREMSRFLLPIHIIAIVLAIGGGMIFNNFYKNHPSIELAFVFIFSTMGLFILLSFGSIFLVAFQYYKSMFSEEGYLTMTLPVKRSWLLQVKVVVGSLWIIIDVFVILVGTVIWMQPFQAEMNGAGIAMEFSEACREFGISIPAFTCTMILSILIGAITSTVLMYACVSVGQLFTNHRILGAVVSYFVLNTIVQVVTLIAMVVTGCFTMVLSETPDMHQYFITLMAISLIISVVECVAGFWITVYILNKKVNLN